MGKIHLVQNKRIGLGRIRTSLQQKIQYSCANIRVSFKWVYITEKTRIIMPSRLNRDNEKAFTWYRFVLPHTKSITSSQLSFSRATEACQNRKMAPRMTPQPSIQLSDELCGKLKLWIESTDNIFE
ncbi:hypothetical protein D3C85_1105280 [compost metagenome]